MNHLILLLRECNSVFLQLNMYENSEEGWYHRLFVKIRSYFALSEDDGCDSCCGSEWLWKLGISSANFFGTHFFFIQKSFTKTFSQIFSNIIRYLRIAMLERLILSIWLTNYLVIWDLDVGSRLFVIYYKYSYELHEEKLE